MLEEVSATWSTNLHLRLLALGEDLGQFSSQLLSEIPLLLVPFILFINYHHISYPIILDYILDKPHQDSAEKRKSNSSVWNVLNQLNIVAPCQVKLGIDLSESHKMLVTAGKYLIMIRFLAQEGLIEGIPVEEKKQNKTKI